MTVVNEFTGEKMTATEEVFMDIVVGFGLAMDKAIADEMWATARTYAKWIDSIRHAYGKESSEVTTVTFLKEANEMTDEENELIESEEITKCDEIRDSYKNGILSDNEVDLLMSYPEVERIEYNGFSGVDPSLLWYTIFLEDGTDFDIYQDNKEDIDNDF